MNKCICKVILFELLLVSWVKSDKAGEWTLLTANAEPFYLKTEDGALEPFATPISKSIGTCNRNSCNITTTKHLALKFNRPELIKHLVTSIERPYGHLTIHKIEKFCSSYYNLLHSSNFEDGYYFFKTGSILFIWDIDQFTLQSCYKGFARETVSNNSRTVTFELQNSSYTIEIGELQRPNLWKTNLPAVFITNDSSMESYYSTTNYYYNCHGFFYMSHFDFFTVKPEESSNLILMISTAIPVGILIASILGVTVFLIIRKKNKLTSADYVEPHFYETPKFVDHQPDLLPSVHSTQDSSEYNYAYDHRILPKPVPPAKPSKAAPGTTRSPPLPGPNDGYAYATFKKQP